MTELRFVGAGRPIWPRDIRDAPLASLHYLHLPSNSGSGRFARQLQDPRPRLMLSSRSADPRRSDSSIRLRLGNLTAPQPFRPDGCPQTPVSGRLFFSDLPGSR